jgi:fibronectin-binding autotransporter adhesin
MKPKFTKLAPRATSLACASILVSMQSNAQEFIKSNDANNLNLASSWSGGTAPGAEDIAAFNNTLTTALNPAIGGNIEWKGIQFTNPGANIGIYNTGTGSSGSILTLGSNGIDMSSADLRNLTIRARTALSSDQTWNVATSRALAIDGWSTSNANGLLYDLDLGGHTLTKSGAGTLNILNGYGIANGSLEINQGTVQLGANSTRVTGLAANASVQINGAGSLSVQNNIATTYLAAGVTKNSVDAVNWKGEVVLNGGRLNISYGTTTGDLNLEGSIVANEGTTSEIVHATTSTSTSTSQFRRDISASITGTGTIDFKANNTTRLNDRITLVGDNSGFAGTARINGSTASSSRTLRIGAATAGSASAAWEIAASNTLEVHGVDANLGSLSGSGTLKNSSSTASTVTVGAIGSSSSFTGIIDAGAGTLNLIKTGNGTLTLGGASTFTGKTTISGGILSINADNRLGASPGSSVANQLILDGGTLASTANFTIGGNRGTQLSSSGGSIQTAEATTLTMWSPISGSGSLSKTGSGTLHLNAYNSFSGGFFIQEGAVTTAATANRFNPGSAITIDSGASLTISANQAIGTLAGAGTMTLSAGTLSLGGAANTSFSGIITGSGALTKSGTGTLTLSGANDYAGATNITAGTLIVGDGTSGSAINSAFSVSGTGKISGSGSIGALTVSTGGTIAPGNSPGVLSTGDFSLSGGSFLVEINGNSAGSEYDQLSVSGSVNLAGVLDLSLGFIPTENDFFFLILNDGSDAITGTFTGLAENSSFSQGGSSFIITYLADYSNNSLTGGNDVAIMAIPEPSFSLLSLLGITALLRRRSS